MMKMKNIAWSDMKNETDPDTPNPSYNSSFSIHSVVGKGVFFTEVANVALRVVAAVVALVEVKTLVGAGAVVNLSVEVLSIDVVVGARVGVVDGVSVALTKLNRYFSAAFILAIAACARSFLQTLIPSNHV